VKVAVIGRGGNAGGTLADLWERAGHEVTRIGREGGDVSDAEAVVVAVHGGAIREALGNVQGIEGKTVIDATNLIGEDPPAGFSSNAEFVKSRTNGPAAKSFNANFAMPYDRIGEAGSTPSNLWCGDEEARQVVEQLNRDAGYEPVYAGPLENAAAQENFVATLFYGISQGGWAYSCVGLRLLINSESKLRRVCTRLPRCLLETEAVLEGSKQIRASRRRIRILTPFSV
jgi:8-hydroxy-5-deazaflavin:NADPH oxidoreductase